MTRWIIAFCVMLGVATPAGADNAEALLEGVDAIATVGNPASLIVSQAGEPLVVAPDGRVFAGCGELFFDASGGDSRRVVALGHGGYFGDARGQTPVFLANAVQWVANGIEREGPLRVHGLPTNVGGVLAERGVEITRVEGGIRGLDLAGVDVMFASPQAWSDNGRFDELRGWLMAGGGLIAGECSWGQLQLKRAPDVPSLACNQLLEPFGILFTDRAESPVRDGVYPVMRERRELAHTGNAFRLLLHPEDAPEEDIAMASSVVASALSVVPEGHPLLHDVEMTRVVLEEKLTRRYGEMADKPLTPKGDPFARVMIDYDARIAKSAPAEDIVAHPSAAAFPGLHGDTHDPERLDLVTLDASIPGWRSMGLWAHPGAQIRICVDPRLVDVGAHVQIGSWLDPQNFEQRVRLAAASRRYPMDAEDIVVASAIGGPIYIDIPERVAQGTGEDAFELQFFGAMEMPRYVHCETDLDEWRDRIRSIPAPWAELESDELVFTVPADVVREMDRPDLVMEHWDTVHRAMQSLEPRTGNHWSERQYRYVCEKRLSWGYMYCPANAPIVIPMSAADEMVDLASFDNEGRNHLWGHYHEMGHAHQNPMWTFGGTGEVTVNIFTVYALHTVNGYPLDSDVMRSNPRTSWDRFEKHKAEGAPFSKWTRDPFLALQTYAMLWHEFGFDAYHAVFDAYRDLPENERPRGDDAERDLFMVMFSEEVGRDLSGYFSAWGVPISDEAAARVAALEDWMPEAPE